MTPGLGSYLIVSGALFAIGLAGVLLRRSPLVVLLSLEVMLNSANLALVGFGRYVGTRDGQVFALVVMGVAAAEVVVGLGLIVAMERRRDGARHRRARGAARVSISSAAWLAYASPLVGCVLIALLGFAGERVPRRAAAWHRERRAAGRRSLFSVIVFLKLRDLPEEARSVQSVAWTWLQSGTFHVDNSILIDQLSAVMLLVVTGVGFLIHLYSVGYMHGDLEERRYFAYLNLFVFSMLILVLAANFVILLVGWGMVGLSSYLLIGFWHQRPSAVAAAKKAFVMNAVGDVGMAIGIFLIFRAARHRRLHRGVRAARRSSASARRR